MKRSLASSFALSTFCLAAAFAFAGRAGADTANLTPVKDNTLIETPVGNSNGAGDGIWVGNVGSLGGGTHRRAVLAFDVSSIPAGSTVNSVTLQMEMSQSPSGVPVIVDLHRLTADWGEAGSFGSGTGGAAQTGDATWLRRFFDTASWTTPGGDFAAASSDSQTVADLGPYQWSGAGLVADVQFWVDNAASNFGWLVKGDETAPSTVKKFYSRQGFTPPALTVDYTPGTSGVPTGPSADGVWFAPPSPSPAAGPVNLAYTLPRVARVALVIHDATGRIVRRLSPDATVSAGRHATVWDGRTDAGARAKPGVYLANLAVDGVMHPRRIALLR